jgi:2-iminobutanoate/2-iminopropanoate deaminase
MEFLHDQFMHKKRAAGWLGVFALVCVLGGMAGCRQIEPYGGVEYLSDSRTPASPFSSAVRIGNYLYVSGQIGVKPSDARSDSDGVEIAARRAMEGVRRALATGGATFDDVFKCTVMLSDIGTWEAFNRVYITYFKPNRLPARSAFGANGLAMHAAFEIECWAYRRPARRD